MRERETGTELMKNVLKDVQLKCTEALFSTELADEAIFQAEKNCEGIVSNKKNRQEKSTTQTCK